MKRLSKNISEIPWLNRKGRKLGGQADLRKVPFYTLVMDLPTAIDPETESAALKLNVGLSTTSVLVTYF